MSSPAAGSVVSSTIRSRVSRWCGPPSPHRTTSTATGPAACRAASTVASRASSSYVSAPAWSSTMKSPSASAKPTATTPGRPRSASSSSSRFTGSPAPRRGRSSSRRDGTRARQRLHEPREHRVLERGLEVEAGLRRVPTRARRRGAGADPRAAPAGRSPARRPRPRRPRARTARPARRAPGRRCRVPNPSAPRPTSDSSCPATTLSSLCCLTVLHTRLRGTDDDTPAARAPRTTESPRVGPRSPHYHARARRAAKGAGRRRPS